MLLTKGNVWGGTVEQELSDAQWKLIQPWWPAPKRRGRPRADDRRTINGVLYVLRTGCRWQDLRAGPSGRTFRESTAVP